MQLKNQILMTIVACYLLLLAGLANGATITGKVVGVSDGDTITVLDSSKTQHKIRLAGIDAPEKAQPFGNRSKEYLSDQVFGKQVEVHSDKTDKYGRTVGKVLI
jgi:endonuclease YncB( thermonuclease family)